MDLGPPPTGFPYCFWAPFELRRTLSETILSRHAGLLSRYPITLDLTMIELLLKPPTLLSRRYLSHNSRPVDLYRVHLPSHLEHQLNAIQIELLPWVFRHYHLLPNDMSTVHTQSLIAIFGLAGARKASSRSIRNKFTYSYLSTEHLSAIW